MPKNILIFSDGTGQAGELRPDQAFRKILSAATGLGIARNIADCYEEIINQCAC